LCLWIFISQGQGRFPENNKFDIDSMLDNHLYEDALVYLQQCIDDKQATDYDRYKGYLEKALLYKRLYNYAGALKNLDIALECGLKSKNDEEVRFRVLLERMFIYFDLQRDREFDALFKQVDESKLPLVGPDTQGFYISILGILAMRNTDFVEAERQFDRAIAIMKNGSPRNVPNVYRAKIGLYGDMGQHDKVLDTYEAGVDYAERYGIDYYLIVLEEAMTRYYVKIKDWENAYIRQNKVSKLRSKYDANNRAGKLNSLEQELLERRNELTRKNERNFRYYLISLLVLLLALLAALGKLYQSNRIKNSLIAAENESMRNLLQQLSSEKSKVEKPNISIDSFDFTKRQLEIIELVKLGKTNKEIGAELFISENTVKYHLKTIYEVLGIYKRSELRENVPPKF